MLPAGSRFPGPWRTDRAPYLRDPMRAFADPAVETVVLLLASQMGKTELGFNVVGWKLDSMPQPALWIAPTQKLALTLSRDRIDKMFSTASTLRDKLDRRYAKPGSLERWVSSVRFGIGWAGSATELASHPAALVIIDERSRMDDDIGGEGDPVRVAQARLRMYANRKLGVFSSPTEEDVCPTHRLWLTGSRMRWCWECPGCRTWFPPEYAQLRWPEGADFDVIRATAVIECPECQRTITDDERLELPARYIPYVVTDDGLVQADGVEVRNSVASYWATGFAAPVGGIGYIAEQLARAAAEGPTSQQAVVNTLVGQLWSVPGERLDAEAVRACEVDGIPDGAVQMVTAGVDVQADSVYYVVRGWGWNAESWLLAHDQLHGDTEYDDVWLALARALEGPFCGHVPAMVLIDSGYRTPTVYDVTYRQPTWWPSKGIDRRHERPYWDTTIDEAPSGRPRRSHRLWMVNTGVWKSWLRTRLRRPQDQPGAWHVPRGIEQRYCDQVTNEQLFMARGRRVWRTTGAGENHYGDCETLCAAAAYIQNVRTLRPPRVEVPESPPPPPNRPPPAYGRRRGI